MHRCLAAALLAAKLRAPSRCEVRLWGPEGTHGRSAEVLAAQAVPAVRGASDQVEDYIRQGLGA